MNKNEGTGGREPSGAERPDRFETSSGADVKTSYGPEDLRDRDRAAALGEPGRYPFTRGVQPNMYRGRLWTMRQYAGFGDAAESNRRYRYLLKHGQTGISIAFDLPTQMGYDADHPRAEGEVGKVGVSVCSLLDVEELFKGILLDAVTTSMTINATAPVLLAFYVAAAKKQGIDPAKLGGTTQNDVLKEYIARGTYVFPPQPSMRLATDIFAYCRDNLPSWNTISISGFHIREAGSTAAQEIAFTFANGIAYVEGALSRGLAVDEFAPRLSFFFASHSNFFEEVAKFRAARRLWARIMKERFQATDPRSMMLRFHTQTGGVTLTAQQVDNNVVRTALQALSAVLGGTQSLHTNAFDEALALPTERSVQLALRTQQVIAFESAVTDTVDPLGGSYYVEWLTDRVEEEAERYVRRIDELGGALRAIEIGYPQREIQANAYRMQRDVEEGRRVVVGVNRFVTDEPPVEGLLRVDARVGERQRRRLKRLRRERDDAAATASLKRLAEAARGDANTMPAFIECAEAYVTLGEMCDLLRGIWGEQKESPVF